jgi:hypothetical protein
MNNESLGMANLKDIITIKEIGMHLYLYCFSNSMFGIVMDFYQNLMFSKNM